MQKSNIRFWIHHALPSAKCLIGSGTANSVKLYLDKKHTTEHKSHGLDSPEHRPQLLCIVFSCMFAPFTQQHINKWGVTWRLFHSTLYMRIKEKLFMRYTVVINSCCLFFFFHLHHPPSVTRCSTSGKADSWNKWPCLIWPTSSGLCHRGPLMHINPPTQWPQSLKSVNRELMLQITDRAVMILRNSCLVWKFTHNLWFTNFIICSSNGCCASGSQWITVLPV